MENTLLLVLAVLWLVAAQTYLLLTTLTLSKKLRLEDQMFFYLLGNGFNLVLYSGLCLAARLLL
jgi:hypothetical protein